MPNVFLIASDSSPSPQRTETVVTATRLSPYVWASESPGGELTRARRSGRLGYAVSPPRDGRRSSIVGRARP